MNETQKQKLAKIWALIQSDQDELLDWAFREAMLRRNRKGHDGNEKDTKNTP